MKLTSTLIAAAFVAGSATLAFAQAGGAGAGAGGGVGSAGSDVSAPRQNMQRPTPNSPPVNRRSDDMAPMQGANVSNQTAFSGKSKSKHKSQARMYR
jgi:hypothetical protein